MASGYRSVTVSGQDGYIYLQKTLPCQDNAPVTVAVVQTAGGLDLGPIADGCCPHAGALSNFRMSNLAYNSQPLDLLLADGRVVYTDVQFKETTYFKQIRPGTYQFYLAETNLLPMPSYLDIETMDSAFIGMAPPSLPWPPSSWRRRPGPPTPCMSSAGAPAPTRFRPWW